MNLTDKIQQKFQKINFDETLHKYTIDGKSAPSVSSVIKKFYKEFDASKFPAFLQKQWKQKGQDAASA